MIGNFLRSGALIAVVDLATKNGNAELAEYLKSLVPHDRINVP